MKEYYYDKLAARANPKPGQPPPPLEVEFEQKVFNFGRVPQGTPLQPRFVFRNLASHDILVEKIHGPEWLIKDATEQRVVPAGADGRSGSTWTPPSSSGKSPRTSSSSSNPSAKWSS